MSSLEIAMSQPETTMSSAAMSHPSPEIAVSSAEMAYPSPETAFTSFAHSVSVSFFHFPKKRVINA
jgi:hypothetical protein